MIRIIALLLHFTLVPIILGRLITYKASCNWLVKYLIGYFSSLAVFYILFSWVEWLQNWTTFWEPVTGGFTLLIKLYTAVLVILAVIWAFLDRKNLKGVPGYIKKTTLQVYSCFKKDKFLIVYSLIFGVLLLAQGYMAFSYEINEWSYDDYDYVVSSKDTISSDTITYVNFIDGTMPNVTEKRAVASWGTYVAMLAKVSGFEVTTVYHTLLPVILLLVAYTNFAYISSILFKRNDDRMIFMIITAVAYMFGLYSHYSMTFRLLGAIWQGKAVLSIIAIPFFIFYLFDLYGKNIENANLLPIIGVSLGMSSLTSLSIMFVPTVAFFMFIMMCIYHKKIIGIRYLIAGMAGPLYLAIFYTMIWMLQSDMKSTDFKFFKFRKSTHWWKKWLH